jgi:hypothetical protein
LRSTSAASRTALSASMLPSTRSGGAGERR